MSEAARHMKEIGIFLDCLFDFGGGLDVYWNFQPFGIHLWVLCSSLPLEKSTCHQKNNAIFFSWANISPLKILCVCTCKSALRIQQGIRTEMVLPDITEHEHYTHTSGKVKFAGVNGFKIRYRNLIITAKQGKTMLFLRWDWSEWSQKELFYHHSSLSSNVVIPWWDGIGVRNHKAEKFIRKIFPLVTSLLFNGIVKNLYIFLSSLKHTVF